MSLADFMFVVRSQANRVIAEDVMIVREMEGYSLSVCCPRTSDLDVLAGFIQSHEGAHWHLAREESDFINHCDEVGANQHILFLAAEGEGKDGLRKSDY